MSSKFAKVVAPAAGAAPVVGIVTLIENPWLALAVFGFLVTLALVVVWLLCRQPFFEMSESVEGDARWRLWRAGLDQSPRGVVAGPPYAPRPVSSACFSAQQPALRDEDAGPPSVRG